MLFLTVFFFFRHNAIAHLIDLRASINFCMRWETKKFVTHFHAILTLL